MPEPTIKPSATFVFPNTETRDTFLGYMSDGGGEWGALESSEDNDEIPIKNFDYKYAFPAWGYKPEEHGEPVVVVT